MPPQLGCDEVRDVCFIATQSKLHRADSIPVPATSNAEVEGSSFVPFPHELLDDVVEIRGWL